MLQKKFLLSLSKFIATFSSIYTYGVHGGMYICISKVHFLTELAY